MKLHIPLCREELVLDRPWTFRTNSYWMAWPLLRILQPHLKMSHDFRGQ